MKFQEATHEVRAACSASWSKLPLGSRGRPQARSSRAARIRKKVLYRSGGISTAELRWAESGANESGSVGRCCPMCSGFDSPAAAYSPWHSGPVLERFFAIGVDGRACSPPYKPIQDSASTADMRARRASGQVLGLDRANLFHLRRMIPDIKNFC